MLDQGYATIQPNSPNPLRLNAPVNEEPKKCIFTIFRIFANYLKNQIFIAHFDSTVYLFKLKCRKTQMPCNCYQSLHNGSQWRALRSGSIGVRLVAAPARRFDCFVFNHIKKLFFFLLVRNLLTNKQMTYIEIVFFFFRSE